VCFYTTPPIRWCSVRIHIAPVLQHRPPAVCTVHTPAAVKQIRLFARETVRPRITYICVCVSCPIYNTYICIYMMKSYTRQSNKTRVICIHLYNIHIYIFINASPVLILGELYMYAPHHCWLNDPIYAVYIIYILVPI